MNYTTLKKLGFVAIIGFLLLFVVDTFCPIENIIGIPCPGCGMSSALYHLIHLDLNSAMFFHPLIIPCLLYFVGIGIAYLRYQSFDNKPVKILTIIFMVALFVVYVYRMITIFPEYPMMYNNDSLLGRIIEFIN